MQVTERPQRESGWRYWLTASPLWQFGLALFVVALALFGVGNSPNAGRMRVMAVSPWDALIPDDYVWASPLGPILAHAIGLRYELGFAVLHLTLVGLSVALSAWIVCRYVSTDAARLVLVAWFCSPLANVMLGWLGQPDPFTLFAGTVAAVCPPIGVLGAGVLLGFNHFEQGLVICAASVGLRRSRRVAYAAAGGLMVGRCLLWGYHQTVGANPSRLDYMTDLGPTHFVELWVKHPVVLVFSIHAVLWVPLVVMFRTHPDRRRLIGVQAAVLVPALFTLDLTRVAAMVSWPLVVFAAVWWSDRDWRRWMPWLLFAAAVVPRVIVWVDDVYV